MTENKHSCTCGCEHKEHRHDGAHEHHHEHGHHCNHTETSCACGHEHHHEHKIDHHECGCGHSHQQEHHHEDKCGCHDHSCGCGHDHHHEQHHDNDCGCGHNHHDHTCSCGHDHHDHHHHDDGCGCGCGHDHNHEQDPEETKRELTILCAGATLLLIGVLMSGMIRTAVLLVAFVLVAWDIFLGAARNIMRGNIFGENFLMTIAGIGAVCIGEIPEGVLVFLLYRLGEYLQTKAVSSSRKSISALLDVRPDRANLLVDGQTREVRAEEVGVGEVIIVRPGEKIPLDGTIMSGESQIDTAALTGESMPRDVVSGQSVMAGCINLNGALEIRVDKAFGESTASRILEMVEHASEKKAVSEKFITRFARVYTPIVVVLAVLVAVLPALIGVMEWSDSLYSALCFLAISCPCALVISVPLSFFAGIGRASREGILVKGGNHLETIAQTEIVAFDKTGTLTAGKFSVHKCIPSHGVTESDLLRYAAIAESRSNHPIAQSICAAWDQEISATELSNYRETAGRGVEVDWNGHHVIAGRADYLRKAGISILDELTTGATAIHVGVDGVFYGSILLRDEPKKDAKEAIISLKKLGISKTAMLSGDSKAVAEEIGRELGLDVAIGELLPGDKVHEVEHLRSSLTSKGKLLYAGDGINDTPVLAAADIGIAMGGLGSDAAIETADVVIMGDEPRKIAEAVRIARRTRRIAMENIVFAIGTKALVMLLSVLTRVPLWIAVFADVGVCMICVLNTLRINRK